MLLLDTSFLVDYEREVRTNQAGPATRLLKARWKEPAAISIISLGEFAEGFVEAPENIGRFIGKFAILQLSHAIALKMAAVQNAACKNGGRLGENDAWIAATAMFYRAELIGREGAFSRVPRLKYTAH